MFFSNGNGFEKFAMDEHYIGPVPNRLTSLFHVGVDCHKRLYGSRTSRR